jgi:hypothetical protein
MENAPLLANTWHNLNVMYQKANATFFTGQLLVKRARRTEPGITVTFDRHGAIG